MKRDMVSQKGAQVRPAFNGLRFVLALAVNCVRIGNFDGISVSDLSSGNIESAWSHSRSWCIHTPLFLFVGGFLLANGTISEVPSRTEHIRLDLLRLLSL